MDSKGGNLATVERGEFEQIDRLWQTSQRLARYKLRGTFIILQVAYVLCLSPFITGTVDCSLGGAGERAMIYVRGRYTIHLLVRSSAKDA